MIALLQQTARDLLPLAQDVKIDLGDFAQNLVVAALLAWALGFTYVHCGTSLSNRRSFARNFAVLAMTTCTIIAIVKANLALSLGLVGALSIVRFRSAIKEPEELAYLFLAIAIGLGLGADQGRVTSLAIALILGVLWAKHRFARSEANQSLVLTVTSSGKERARIEDVVAALRGVAAGVDMRRLDEDGEQLEASFLVDFDDFEKLSRGKEALEKLSPSMRISFLDNKGIS